MSLEAALSGLVATGLPATDVCGAGSQIAGTSLLTFTGGTLAPNTSCTFAVTLQVPAGAATGTHANATSAVTATVAGSAVTSPPATDGLELALLTLSKAFTDDPVVAGPTVTLQFTLTNASPTTSATAIAFTDDLTDVLTGLVATGLPLNNACNGTGTLIGASGDTVLTFSGGTLAPGTSCTFGTTLTVPAGITPGAYPNTTAPGGATLGGAVTLPPATDALQIVEPLSITKAFTNDPVVPGGTVTLAFTITNAALQAATALAFTDDLGAALTGLVATGLPAADVCGAGSSIAGTSLLTFTGGSLGAGASCTFQVTLQVPAGLPFGTLATNTTSAVTGTVGGVGVTGDAATDTLVVNLLTFTKVFDGVKPPGATSTLTFTITNLNQAAGATGLRFTDDLSAALSGLVATGLPATAVCGAGSTITGTSFLTFEGGTLGPGGSCSVAVTLQVPVSALDGVHVNTTSLLSVGGLEAANPASAGLQVAGQADLSITKSDDPDPVLTGETLTYTVTVHNAGPHLAPNVVVTDTLPGGLTLVSTAGCAEDPAGVPSCSLGTIPVGGSAQYTITTTVNVGGTAAVTNQATVAANRADPDGANNTASEVTATPALCIITGPTAAATFTAESPFLALVGTCLANTVARGADASSAVTTVTWTNDRGGSGTATGTTNRSAPLVPLQPGTNQITVTGTTGGGRTDSATLTVTVSRLVYYLAEGATGPFFDLDLLLSNSNGTAAPVTITYLKEDGTTIVQAVTLAANSQQSIRVNDVPGLATSPVSIVVSSDSALPIAVERSMLWDASVPAPRGAVGPAIASGATHYGGHTAKAVDSPRTAWFFAEGSQGFFDTYLLLANANLTPATATVTYLLEGAAPVVQVVPVGPTSRVTLFAGRSPCPGRPVVRDPGHGDAADHRRARHVLQRGPFLGRGPRVRGRRGAGHELVPRRGCHRTVLRQLRPGEQSQRGPGQSHGHVPARHGRRHPDDPSGAGQCEDHDQRRDAAPAARDRERVDDGDLRHPGGCGASHVLDRWVYDLVRGAQLLRCDGHRHEVGAGRRPGRNRFQLPDLHPASESLAHGGSRTDHLPAHQRYDRRQELHGRTHQPVQRVGERSGSRVG